MHSVNPGQLNVRGGRTTGNEGQRLSFMHRRFDDLDGLRDVGNHLASLDDADVAIRDKGDGPTPLVLHVGQHDAARVSDTTRSAGDDSIGVIEILLR